MGLPVDGDEREDRIKCRANVQRYYPNATSTPRWGHARSAIPGRCGGVGRERGRRRQASEKGMRYPMSTKRRSAPYGESAILSFRLLGYCPDQACARLVLTLKG